MEKLVLHICGRGHYVSDGESVSTFEGFLIEPCLTLEAGTSVIVAAPASGWAQATVLSLLRVDTNVTFTSNFITVENETALKLDGIEYISQY